MANAFTCKFCPAAIRFFCLALWVVYVPLYSEAQHAHKQTFFKRVFGKVTYDTNYVASHYYDFHLTGVSVLRSHRINVYDHVSKTEFRFVPNNSFTFGLGFDWRFLTFEYSRVIPAIERNDTLEKGVTQGSALRFGLTGKKFLASFLIQSYRGFYVNNPTQSYPGWSGSGYPIRADLSSIILHASLYYNFNPKKYSLMAQLWQIDRQLKSAGSWMAGITFNINGLFSDSVMVQGPLSRETGRSEPIKSSANGLIGINAGYGYNWVIRNNFFISALCMPGINVQSASIERLGGELEETESRIGFHGDFRLVAGYNGPLWYSGIHFSNYFMSSSLNKSVSLNQNNVYLRFFIGRRFLLKHP